MPNRALRRASPDELLDCVPDPVLPTVLSCPFYGVTPYIGCLRHETIIGVSKFTRIVHKHARRFTVQERIAQGIADELVEILDPHGIIVCLHAHHSCTQCRGVREMGASTRTIEKRGAYASDHGLVREFMDLAGVYRIAG